MEFVKVDNEKFHKELRRRGLQITVISREMGYGKSTIGEAVRGGKLKQTQAILMEKLYNIKPEDYAPTEEISGGAEVPQVNYNEIYKTIYSAVYNAVKQAWRDS